MPKTSMVPKNQANNMLRSTQKVASSSSSIKVQGVLSCIVYNPDGNPEGRILYLRGLFENRRNEPGVQSTSWKGKSIKVSLVTHNRMKPGGQFRK